jgi:IS30 family transposase
LTVQLIYGEHWHEKNYTHLSRHDRNEIQELKERGYGVRAIARILGRGIGTISEELRRNQVLRQYDADKAHLKATIRRKAAKYQGKKIVANSDLQAFIDKALMQRQSPEAIAGRLKAGLEPGLPYVSRDTIETYITSVHGRRIEYQLKVLKAGQKRRGRRKRPSSPPPGDPKTFIDDRPDVIRNRERVGDLEVDFIVSGKTGSGYCLTAADRKLRVGFIRKILPVTVANALKALQDIKKQFPEITSITTDNDLLFRFHKQLEEALGVPFYFCHPYSSWEKGGIENYNGQARKYIRKGSDISQYGEVYIQTIETKLNNRYMEVLGYRTPQEALDEYRQQMKHKQSR